MVSIAFHSSSSHAAPATRRSLGQRLTSAWDVLIDEWHIRQAVRSLEALDSHVLADMGIPLGGVEDAVRHGR